MEDLCRNYEGKCKLYGQWLGVRLQRYIKMGYKDNGFHKVYKVYKGVVYERAKYMPKANCI